MYIDNSWQWNQQRWCHFTFYLVSELLPTQFSEANVDLRNVDLVEGERCVGVNVTIQLQQLLVPDTIRTRKKYQTLSFVPPYSCHQTTIFVVQEVSIHRTHMHTSFFLHFGIFDSMLSLFLFFLSWVYFARLTCLVHRGTVPSCGERSPGRWHTENILANVGKARSFLWKWARQSHGRRSGPLLLLFWSTQALLHSLSPCSHLYKKDKIICEWMHTSRTERGERERERERESSASMYESDHV